MTPVTKDANLTTSPRRNAFTIDVEDYFQVSAFEAHIERRDWSSLPCRIERNMDRILAILNRHGVQATFFTLGWIAERFPRIIRELVDGGHELASHGYEHIRVTQQNRADFGQDIRRTKTLLEDIGGVEVLGYRAASYSIDRSCLWAHDELREAGYRYSSSIYPIHHDLYGIPDAPRFAYFPRADDDTFVEIPITTTDILGYRLPCGGGGYFRLFPYALSRWAIERVNRQDRESAIFYFHPWEIDPEQPQQVGLKFKTRFRHYLNLHRTEARLNRLLTDFQWDRMDRLFLAVDKSTAGASESGAAPLTRPHAPPDLQESWSPQ
ncbi:XrtA system polysaccharide deacetylase [Thiocystis violascens]|uniref:Polysaccharide deactylase family protein, PEP-CTERM locus subfamily n=1 Tax=Thiocystis violascens (strain ATCC 17096 / DSM 198 / 6111) TaxID=765911 RepID=I3YGE9_THIV6|nr:XrtA system polysaccharide deacetylase [Thiocystis violascens]AFL76067.1 polysaccharide deactylase family protein, PEP-CTERM locus subfamily [Thiocystis violascens DSM 198]